MNARVASAKKLAASSIPVLIGICFLWSASGKTADIVSTVALFTSRGSSQTLGTVAAWNLVFFELALGSWLISGVRAELAAITAGLFLVFASASILYQLWTKSQLSCGCGLPTFGLSPESGQLLGLVRNSVLIVLVVLSSVPHETALDSPRTLERSL
ncbi:MAG: hypothetical protein JSS51_15555 [Planctomycetes bacterium]|nr:hypothetical protein [Planctomycetota bacterium]